MLCSVVVPAHDEELLLPRCLGSVAAAASGVDAEVEVVVVANRCTDSTEEVAERAGAVVVAEGSRNIAAVRNAGAAAARGEVLLTLDADCVMHPGALAAVLRLIGTGSYVGGGTKVVPERRSPGITATYALVSLMTSVTRLSAGMFWCKRSDFEAVGGFDEGILVGEDLHFARRLRSHGRRSARRFTMLRSTPVVASCRKFDRFGDWHMFRMARELPSIRASMVGRDTVWVDRYFFDFNDRTTSPG